MGRRDGVERLGEAAEDRVDERSGEGRIGALQQLAEVAEVAVELVDLPLSLGGRGSLIGRP